MFCPKCGAQVTDAYKLCPSCGSVIEVVASVTSENKLNDEIGATTVLTQNNCDYDNCEPTSLDKSEKIVETTSTNDNRVNDVLEKKAKKRKVAFIVLILLFVVIVFATYICLDVFGILDGVSVSGRKSERNDDDDTSETVSEQSGEESANEVSKESSGDVSDENSEIPYSKIHLSKAIEAWSNYSSYGVPCDLTYGVDKSKISHLLTNDQKQSAASVAKCDCASVSKIKEHMKKYFSDELCKGFNDARLISYSGELYCLLGAVGYMSYESDAKELNVLRISNDKISVRTKRYNSAGMVYCESAFDFEYIDGAYKIVMVTDLDSNETEPETKPETKPENKPEQPQPSKDFSDYCGFYEEFYSLNEPGYYFVLESYDATTRKAAFRIDRVGANASYIYTTETIYAYIGNDGVASFDWTDSWGNKGIGTFKLCGNTTKYVELEVIVTEKSDFNRSTLSTGGIKTIYKRP